MQGSGRLGLLGLGLGLAFSLAACTMVGPNFVSPEVKLQERWNTSLSTTAASQDAAAFWANFQDPTLIALLRQAEQQNPTLQSAAQALVQAESTVRITRSGLFPSVQLNGSNIYNQPDLAAKLLGRDQGATTEQVFGQVSWELDFWGQQRRALEADRANLEASKAALATAHLSLLSSVASIYCHLRIIEQRLVVGYANLAQQAENMRIAEARFRLGASSELDWRQAQTLYSQTQAQIPVLQTSLAQYQHALSVLLGEPPDYFARTYPNPVGLPAVPPPFAFGAPRDLLRQRPDVRQAERLAASQSARIGQAEAALLPAFSLSGNWGFSTTRGIDELFTWDSRAWSRGIGFYFPLFDRGRLRAQVKIQDSLFQQAVLSYQNTVLKAQQEVADALSSFSEGQTQLAELLRAESAAQRSADLALIRYRAGQTDYTTVSNAELARLQTADGVVQARGNLLQSSISVFRALGGVWTVEEKKTP